jgi:hypothetical protein
MALRGNLLSPDEREIDCRSADLFGFSVDFGDVVLVIIVRLVRGVQEFSDLACRRHRSRLGAVDHLHHSCPMIRRC